MVAIETSPSHMQLDKLYLLPAFRNQGVGSLLLQDLLCLAAQESKPLSLRVLRVNTSAQRFYLRHDFVVTDVTKERIFMEAAASSPNRLQGSSGLPWRRVSGGAER